MVFFLNLGLSEPLQTCMIEEKSLSFKDYKHDKNQLTSIYLNLNQMKNLILSIKKKLPCT